MRRIGRHGVAIHESSRIEHAEAMPLKRGLLRGR